MADQWKEYFYCDALPADVIVTKGKRRTSGRSSNRHGSENVITDGSLIVVNDGQCMVIVEQGKVVDLCSEPGEYTYQAGVEPSLFCGDLSQSIRTVFDAIGKRFAFGGEAPADQRIYYFNTKEMTGNKYGTPSPVPFRVVDANIGLDVDISIRCFGEYSYRVTNPILFYTNVCGNVEREFTRDEIESQLKSELLTALQPAFARISDMGIRYSALPAHTAELADVLNAVLSAKWGELRGIEIASFGVSSVTAFQEDENMIKELQRNAAFRNPTMAAAHMVGAQADAMRAAASNKNGAAMGFMGMNMAGTAGGMNVQDLYNMGQRMNQAAPGAGAQTAVGSGAASAPEQPSAGASTVWTCACGASNSGKFCSECGAPRPAESWTCACGSINKGKFCSNCGAPKPVKASGYRCDKCGWEPADPANPPKFCPECGTPFNKND